MKNTFSLLLIVLITTMFTSCEKDENKNNTISNGTVTDIDGNIYHTVKIGTQVWMSENLKVTKYRNGDPIPNVIDGTAWHNLSSGAYCHYDNDSNNSTTYGNLYNWYAVHDSRNITPKGWHIPTDAEWTTLTDYLGGEEVAGAKLKETGGTHWESPNSGATNMSGFNALPGGDCNDYIEFFSIRRYGHWWSSTKFDATSVWIRDLCFDEIYVIKNIGGIRGGFSVRCIMD